MKAKRKQYIEQIKELERNTIVQDLFTTVHLQHYIKEFLCDLLDEMPAEIGSYSEYFQRINQILEDNKPYDSCFIIYNTAMMFFCCTIEIVLAHRNKHEMHLSTIADTIKIILKMNQDDIYRLSIVIYILRGCCSTLSEMKQQTNKTLWYLLYLQSYCRTTQQTPSFVYDRRKFLHD